MVGVDVDLDREFTEMWQMLRIGHPFGSRVPSAAIVGIAADLSSNVLYQDELVRRHLAPSLRLMEEAINWLHWFTAALSECHNEHKEPGDAVPFMMAALSCQLATAVRAQILLGLDTPARISLRAQIESLHMLTVAFADLGFRRRYAAAVTPEAAHLFWKKEIAAGALDDRIDAIEAACGGPEEVALLRNMRLKVARSLSAFVHPILSNAAMSAFTPAIDNADGYRQNTIGGASEWSRETLDIASTSIWNAADTCCGLVVRSTNRFTLVWRPNSDSEADSAVMVGAHVLHAACERWAWGC